MVEIARSELVLGGQRSGKSRRAESLACQWLAADDGHRAILLATAEPWDDEMRRRIAHHRADRALRVPGMSTVEASRDISAVITAHSTADTLIVVDCLTLWLTNMMMPAQAEAAIDEPGVRSACMALTDAMQAAPGPVVLVSNEIGWGVIPMGPQVRAFVDAQGRLNQQLGAVCERVTLMAAGLPLTLKGPR